MKKIIVTNTAIIVNDYTWGDAEKLEKSFSKWNPITHSLDPFILHYDKENKRLYLPCGIDLWYVQKQLEVHDYERILHHPYQSTGKIQLRYPPRDDRQWEALHFLLGMNQYEDNQYQSVLGLNLSTGLGKTYISIAAISALRMKAIIITGSGTLLRQWQEEILHYTDLNVSDVYQINGSSVVNRILQDHSSKASNAKIYLCTHGTLQSYGKQFGWNKIGVLFEHLGIGLKIIDEFHMNIANSWLINYYTNVKYTYLVTATPERSSWNEDRIFNLSMKNIRGIDLFDEEKDPHVKYFAIKYNSKPSPIVISQCRNKYGLDRMKYVNWLTKSSKPFYQVLHVITTSFILKTVFEKHGQVLIYIGTNDGILRVYKWLCDNYPELLGEIGIFTSLLPKEEKVLEKEKKVILTTIKSAGAGEHIENLLLTIVLAEPFKSSMLAKQTLGRNRNPNTLYLELVDVGFQQTRNFYNAKLHVFNKYAMSTQDDTLSAYELEKRVENIHKKRDTGLHNPIQFYDTRFQLPSDISNVHEAIQFFDEVN